MIVTFEEPLLIFVHIPKTGGTSLEYWIEDSLPKHSKWKYKNINHLSFEEIKTITKRRISIEGHYKFSIVRNPYDRAYSLFQQVSRQNNLTNFEDIFINKRLQHPFIGYFDTMTNYLKGGMDHAFKYEDFPQIIDHLGQKFNFTKEFKIVNPNDSITHGYEVYPIKEFKYYKEYEQNKHWISIINDIYYEDFINFDYKML